MGLMNLETRQRGRAGRYGEPHRRLLGLLEQRLQALPQQHGPDRVDDEGLLDVLDVDRLERRRVRADAGVGDDEVHMVDARGFDLLDRPGHVRLGRALDGYEEKSGASCGGQGFQVLNAFGVAVAHAADDDVVGPREVCLNKTTADACSDYQFCSIIRLVKTRRAESRGRTSGDPCYENDRGVTHDACTLEMNMSVYRLDVLSLGVNKPA